MNICTDLGRSLAFLKFTLKHNRESRTFWRHKVNSIYAKRWLCDNRSSIGELITSFCGDNCEPFQRVCISPEKYIDENLSQEQSDSHSSVVRLVTAFENFLYDSIQRMFFLDPTRIGKSDVKVDVDQLVNIDSSHNLRVWLSHFMADKYCRSKTPKELIEKTCSLSGADRGAIRAAINEWAEWTLVRNAIAHLGGDVTKELSQKWTQRFPRPFQPIVLTDAEVRRIAELGQIIAKHIDNGVKTRENRKKDAYLLGAELFNRKGISNPGPLAALIHQILSIRVNRRDIERLIPQWRRHSPDEGIAFSDEMLH